MAEGAVSEQGKWRSRLRMRRRERGQAAMRARVVRITVACQEAYV